jgi:uncharacterized protein YggE
MHVKQAVAAFALVAGCVQAGAQQPSQVQLKIDSSNRSLSASAEERVTADAEIAVLHIGFETQLSDAKTAYALGAKTSNEIVAALKQAGLPDASIRSESQHLDRDYSKPHKFKLVQQWTVKAPPERVAEILDIAVAAGATDSGDIEWTVKDVRALEDQALDQAAARARADALVMAKGMGVHLGALIYATNQVSGAQTNARPLGYANYAYDGQVAAERSHPAPALAIEPRKVSRTASVYAVYAIE